MLSDKELQLLTAFVDGEMTRRQRKAVLRLLHKSSEARAFLRDLQENVHRLKQLPYQKLEPGFAGQVLGNIAERGVQPLPDPGLLLRRRRFPGWAGWAAAAAILLALIGGYFAFVRNAGENPPIAEKKDPVRPPESVPPPLNVRLAFQDLKTPERKEKLQEGIRKEKTVHLDVQVANSKRAVERLTEVFKENGIPLHVDQAARASMKKNQPKAVYYVYAENIGAEELLAMLDKLGADETRGKQVQKSTFQNMAVTTITTQDRQTLKDLVGDDLSSDPSLFDTKAIEAPQGTEADKGPKDNKKKTEPQPQTPQRFAVVLADSGRGSPSNDMRTLLAKRGPRAPGTMQVLLIVQQA